jgi:hypothetical protein
VNLKLILTPVVTWWSDYRRVFDWWYDLFDSDIARDYTLQFTIYTHARTSVHSHVFTNRFSVASSKGGLSLSSGFPNYLRPQLPDSHSNSSQQLSPSSPLANLLTHQPTDSILLNWHSLTVLLLTSRHGPRRKLRFSVAVYGPLPNNGRCLVVCFAVVV